MSLVQFSAKHDNYFIIFVSKPSPGKKNEIPVPPTVNNYFLLIVQLMTCHM